MNAMDIDQQIPGDRPSFEASILQRERAERDCPLIIGKFQDVSA